MCEHHECKKEFSHSRNHEPCRIAHLCNAVHRLYRQRNHEAGRHAGTRRSPHRYCTCSNPCILVTFVPGSNNRSTVSSGQKQTIKISGSTTVLPIVQKAADQYMATHANADIQVSGGGSGVGIQAIGAKTVDIGMSSREVTKEEMAKNPTFVVTPLRRMALR